MARARIENTNTNTKCKCCMKVLHASVIGKCCMPPRNLIMEVWGWQGKRLLAGAWHMGSTSHSHPLSLTPASCNTYITVTSLHLHPVTPTSPTSLFSLSSAIAVTPTCGLNENGPVGMSSSSNLVCTQVHGVHKVWRQKVGHKVLTGETGVTNWCSVKRGLFKNTPTTFFGP